ncbi:hypothetical protein [Bradyrhizobium sp.]|uniref:hypothetical protein n=1 Tax=Bradyrhizobium sp. TaxID=376 RepID=UPI0025C6EAD6|nr:hypothetical protein [Bradyrhizobium sp.]
MSFQTDLREGALRLLGNVAVVTEPVGPERDIKLTFGRYERWIYEGGANVLGPSTDKRFEIYDFDDLDHLKTSVLAFPASLSARRDCPNDRF